MFNPPKEGTKNPTAAPQVLYTRRRSLPSGSKARCDGCGVAWTRHVLLDHPPPPRGGPTGAGHAQLLPYQQAGPVTTCQLCSSLSEAQELLGPSLGLLPPCREAQEGHAVIAQLSSLPTASVHCQPRAPSPY